MLPEIMYDEVHEGTLDKLCFSHFKYTALMGLQNHLILMLIDTLALWCHLLYHIPESFLRRVITIAAAHHKRM